MPSASELTPDTATMNLFVGPTKSGKKCAASSYPGPTYYFDFDMRIKGLIAAKEWGVDVSQIDYDYYPPEPGVVENTEKKLSELIGQYNTGLLKYKTIILGSITGQTFAYLQQGNRLTHAPGNDGKAKGKTIGTTNMAGPAEYGYEATATYNLLGALRRMQGINIIVTAHVVPRYGKSNPADPYSETIEVGSKLSIRDKIAANAGIYFTEVYEFRKELRGTNLAHEVRFRSDIASTTHAKLPNGWSDITGKNFYQTVQGRIQSK